MSDDDNNSPKRAKHSMVFETDADIERLFAMTEDEIGDDEDAYFAHRYYSQLREVTNVHSVKKADPVELLTACIHLYVTLHRTWPEHKNKIGANLLPTGWNTMANWDNLPRTYDDRLILGYSPTFDDLTKIFMPHYAFHEYENDAEKRSFNQDLIHLMKFGSFKFRLYSDDDVCTALKLTLNHPHVCVD